MIVLLSYSTNLLASENYTIPSTGRQDSILIAYDDLRKVNSKLIELEYEKEINEDLKRIVSNDSIAIDGLKRKVRESDRIYKEKIKTIKKQRNIVCGIGIVSIILLVISIL